MKKKKRKGRGKAKKYLDTEAVGRRIKAIRKKLGLTQGEFAEKLTIKQPPMNRYENGRIPEGNILTMIADMGKVSVQWILRGGPAPWDESEELPKRLLDLAYAFKELSDKDYRILEICALLTKHILFKITDRNGKSFAEMSVQDTADALGSLEDDELHALNRILQMKVGIISAIVQQKTRLIEDSELFSKGKVAREKIDNKNIKDIIPPFQRGRGRPRVVTRVLSDEEFSLVHEITKDEKLRTMLNDFLQYLHYQFQKKQNKLKPVNYAPNLSFHSVKRNSK